MPPEADSSKKAQEFTTQRNVVDSKLTDTSLQVDDKLYDAEKLASMHPGGELFVKVFAGRDATEAFLSYHRRKFPHSKMTDYYLGSTKSLRSADKEDQEYLDLCEKIEKVLPKYKAFAPFSYYCKVIGLLTLTVALEIYIHTTKSYIWYLTGLQGLFFAWVGMNIQHDANHGAISRTAWINRLLGLTQNYIGGSAVDWIHQHVVQHHMNPNHVDFDPDIVGNPILRLNPQTPRLWIQAYQGLYIFGLLALFGITYIYFAIQHVVTGHHFSDMSKLIVKQRLWESLGFVFFLCRWCVLPYVTAADGVSYVSICMNILPMFIVGGYYLAFFFLISHNFKDVKVYKHQETSFLRRQVETASNVGGSFLCFFNGGLNYQIEHHLFPRIQHTHYPLIAPIVKEYCESKGIIYRHFPSVWSNVQACLDHLTLLGNETVPEKFAKELVKNQEQQVKKMNTAIVQATSTVAGGGQGKGKGTVKGKGAAQ